MKQRFLLQLIIVRHGQLPGPLAVALLTAAAAAVPVPRVGRDSVIPADSFSSPRQHLTSRTTIPRL